MPKPIGLAGSGACTPSGETRSMAIRKHPPTRPRLAMPGPANPGGVCPGEGRTGGSDCGTAGARNAFTGAATVTLRDASENGRPTDGRASPKLNLPLRGLREGSSRSDGIQRQRVKNAGSHGLALVLYTLLAVLFTWPVAGLLRSGIAGQPGDNLQFVWLIDWYKRALFELGRSPLFDPWLNFPEGWSLSSIELPHTMIGFALPLVPILGAVGAYNFTSIASFLASALVPYAYVKRWTGSNAAALIAGTSFGFTPFRQSHFLIGHLNLLGTFWPALYILSLIDICIGRGRSLKGAGLLCASLVATALTSQYYLYMSLILSAPIVAAFWMSGNLRGGDGHRARTILAVGLGAAIPLVVIAIWPYLELRRTGTIGARSREYVRGYSASPTDYVLPATTSMVWGPWVSSHFDRFQWVEGTLYLGAAGAGLAAVSLLRRRRLADHGPKLVLACVALGATAFVLSLGTDLQWMSTPVLVPVPEFAHTWLPGPQAHVPLPGRLLFEYLPLYSSMRVPMRFGLFVILAVSLLAGLGAGHILARLRRPGQRLALGAFLVALVVMDFIPKAAPMFEVRPRAVDAWLRDQPGNGAVAQFPFDLSEDQYQVYYTSVHRKPFLGGFFNAFPPTQYQSIRPVMTGFPDSASVALLKELRIEYVIVSESGYSEFAAVEAEILHLGLCPAVALEGEHVYKWCSD